MVSNILGSGPRHRNSTGSENLSDGSPRLPGSDGSEVTERECSVPSDSETENGW